MHYGLGKHLVAVGLGGLLKVSEVGGLGSKVAEVLLILMQMAYWLSVTYGVVHFFVKM